MGWLHALGLPVLIIEKGGYQPETDGPACPPTGWMGEAVPNGEGKQEGNVPLGEANTERHRPGTDPHGTRE